jgi:hypothetical protein
LSKIKIIRENCDPELANDRSLPCTTYLVEYIKDNVKQWDIVICNKKVDIFDHYWDRYREGLIKFTQTEGRLNPKVWEDPLQVKEKKKR